MEYNSATKKKEITSFVVKWMEMEGIMLSEISQERQIPNVITLIWKFYYVDLKEESRIIITRG
jgi:hypothetical protein